MLYLLRVADEWSWSIPWVMVLILLSCSSTFSNAKWLLGTWSGISILQGERWKYPFSHPSACSFVLPAITNSCLKMITITLTFLKFFIMPSRFIRNNVILSPICTLLICISMNHRSYELYSLLFLQNKVITKVTWKKSYCWSKDFLILVTNASMHPVCFDAPWIMCAIGSFLSVLLYYPSLFPPLFSAIGSSFHITSSCKKTKKLVPERYAWR